jgi:hypothetical protein
VDLVYLAGAPATGKSSLMAELTRGAERLQRVDVKLVPFDELSVGGDVIGAEIGKRRANFPGTDTLAMNALPRVSEWLGRQLYDVICAEGDRLTHIRFLDAAAAAGYRVNLFVLGARMSVLDERCEARGSTQNRPWRMSRGTMCSRVGAAAEEAGYRVFHLNAERPIRELAEDIRGIVPVLRRLQAEAEAEAEAEAAV